MHALLNSVGICVNSACASMHIVDVYVLFLHVHRQICTGILTATALTQDEHSDSRTHATINKS